MIDLHFVSDRFATRAMRFSLGVNLFCERFCFHRTSFSIFLVTPEPPRMTVFPVCGRVPNLLSGQLRLLRTSKLLLHRTVLIVVIEQLRNFARHPPIFLPEQLEERRVVHSALLGGVVRHRETCRQR